MRLSKSLQYIIISLYVVSAAFFSIILSGCGYMSGVYAVRVYQQEGKREKIVKLLSDNDPNTREEAVGVLPKMGECSPSLYSAVADKEPRVRAALAKGLAYCNTEEASKILTWLLADDNGLVRKNSVEPAMNNDYCRDDCLFAVRKLLDDGDAFVKLSAAKALVKRFPQEARAAVIDSLSSKTHVVKKEALTTLPLFMNEDDIYYLGDFLQDPDMSLRVIARKGIETIVGRPVSGQELASIMAKEKVPAIEPAEKNFKNAPPRNAAVSATKEQPRLSDFGLSKTGAVKKDAIAVIIGNMDYPSVDIPRVEYALRDAELMKKVAEDVLGVPANNIIYVENAKSSDFNKIFGTATDPRGLLANWAKPTSDIYIYYSGHGSPDVDSGEAYFVPVDSDINYIRLSGYPVKLLYKNLGMLNAKSVTVMLDACFSGLSHSGSLTKSASPVFVNVADPSLAAAKTEMTIISSSRANEISSWDNTHRHGLFTYNLVKALKDGDSDKDGVITIKEIEIYLSQNVRQSAKRMMNREQNPQVVGVKDRIFARVKPQ